MCKKLAIVMTAMTALASSGRAQDAWDFQVEQVEIVPPAVSLPLCRPAAHDPVNDLMKSADIPDVTWKAPYSEEANFMSLAGHLRYLTYEHTGVWLSSEQAVSVVKTQTEAASR